MSEHPHDDHCWLTVGGSAWKIRAIRQPVMYLWRGYWPDLQFGAVRISDADWDSYCDFAVLLLDRPPTHAGPLRMQ